VWSGLTFRRLILHSAPSGKLTSSNRERSSSAGMGGCIEWGDGSALSAGSTAQLSGGTHRSEGAPLNNTHNDKSDSCCVSYASFHMLMFWYLPLYWFEKQSRVCCRSSNDKRWQYHPWHQSSDPLIEERKKVSSHCSVVCHFPSYNIQSSSYMRSTIQKMTLSESLYVGGDITFPSRASIPSLFLGIPAPVLDPVGFRCFSLDAGICRFP
jgi:hypothetical protein